MNRLSFTDIYNLKKQTKDIGYCNILTDEIYKILYKTNIWDTEEVLVVEDYDFPNRNEPPGSRDRAEYVTTEITKFLNYYGILFVRLSNSSADCRTYIHTFVLVLLGDNSIWRIESYGGDPLDFNVCGNIIYTTRLVEWPTMINDIKRLFVMSPGSERVAYWNGLFSGNATVDTSFDMDITFTHK